MPQFELTEIITKDGIVLEGIYAKPAQPTKKALVWVHGLTSTFYGNILLMNTFAQACGKVGYGFVAFNNRGHDLIASLAKMDKRKKKGSRHIDGGAGYEDFSKSIFDIDAAIAFLVQQGFTEVILVGHSTGANKVCYYGGLRNDSRVAGIVLAGPLSDRLDTELDSKKLQKDLNLMKDLIKQRKGNELLLGYHFFPITPKRFISLFHKNSLEDQFDYGDEKPQLKYLRRIKKPLLVVLGEADEYLDRPAKKLLSVFDELNRSKNYKSVLVSEAFHSFDGKEPEFVSAIIEWTKSL